MPLFNQHFSNSWSKNLVYRSKSKGGNMDHQVKKLVAKAEMI